MPGCGALPSLPQSQALPWHSTSCQDSKAHLWAHESRAQTRVGEIAADNFRGGSDSSGESAGRRYRRAPRGRGHRPRGSCCSRPQNRRAQLQRSASPQSTGTSPRAASTAIAAAPVPDARRVRPGRLGRRPTGDGLILVCPQFRRSGGNSECRYAAYIFLPTVTPCGASCGSDTSTLWNLPARKHNSRPDSVLRLWTAVAQLDNVNRNTAASGRTHTVGNGTHPAATVTAPANTRMLRDHCRLRLS